jgi:uncharacterized membrane protein
MRSGTYGEGRAGRWSSPWVIRTVVAVVVLILVVAIVYAAVNGVLFSVTKR